MKSALATSVSVLALLGASASFTSAHAQETASSPIDSLVPTNAEQAAPAVVASTGNAVLDRLNALESRIKQLEARNAELEEQAAETQNRVQNVEVRAAKSVQASWAPTFSDVNDKFTFKPRGVLQVDYANYANKGGGYRFSDGTDIRRARFGFEGTFYKKFKWRLDAEFVKNTVNLLDAYIGYDITPKWSITVGQQKAPYGLEANTSDTVNTFLERSFASNAFGAVGAERRVGALLGYKSDKLNAAVGIFGGGEGVTRNAVTRNEPFSYNGRVTWDPILDTGRVVHLGVSGYHVSNFGGNTVTLSDRPNVRVDNTVLVSTAISPTAAKGSYADGAKSATYFGAEGAVVYDRFSVQGEYGKLAINRFAAPTVHAHGFNIFGTFSITGEPRSFSGGNVARVKPYNDFDPANGHWGAFELAARYDTLDLRDINLAVPTLPTATAFQGGRRAKSYTVGLNWYLNPNLRAVFNYIRFSGINSSLVTTNLAGAPLLGNADGSALATRLQFDF